ncbi:MAG TPA: hypothetical protein VK946_03475 [Methylotenera sp.]|nr:hypothetical protein [Methylotenera sp.]
MSQIIKTCIALVLLTILNGCAVGVTHQYDNASLNIKTPQSTKLGIGVQDIRVYVINKQKPENFVGLSRGGYGNPFDVTTTSKKPLANDFSTSIQTALSAKGVQVDAISLPVGTSEPDAIKRLASTGEKSVLLMFNEWKADTYMSTTLTYDIQALVIDANGTVLSRKRKGGSENLGGSVVNPPAHSRSAVPVAYRKILEDLFATPEISNYL